MQGIPGSGKTTVANAISRDFLRTGTDAIIHSTDSFWYEKGVYNYDPSKAEYFHRLNQKSVIDSMRWGTEIIIVDNTNITRWEARPYIVMAKIYSYNIQIVRVYCSVEEAIKRQLARPIDRRIPEDVIRRKFDAMEELTYEI